MVEDFQLPISFNPETKTFRGLKYDYKILDSLPVCRYKEIDLVQVEMMFGCNVDTIISFAKTVYTNINKGSNRADDAINAYKLMEAGNSLKERQQAVFKFVDLFTVRKGIENDLLNFGGDTLKDKVDDWGLIDLGFFLTIAVSLMPNYTKNLKQLSLLTSKETESE